MKRLKIRLQYESSRYIHLAISSVLFVLTIKSYYALILLLIHLIFLIHSSKNLLIYSLVVILVLTLRIDSFNRIEEVNSGTIISIEDNKLIVKNGYSYILYVNNSSSYEIGMKIRFDYESYERDPMNLLGGFDYKNFLKSKNIRNEIIAKDIEVIDKDFSIYRIREGFDAYLDSNYSKSVSSYLKLFLLGEKDEVDDFVLDNANKLGISHLFVVSGMHLGLLVMAVKFFLKKLYLRADITDYLIIVLLVVYNVLTAFAFSIMRASLLVIGLFIFKNRFFSRLDISAFILVGYLLYNPYLVFNQGFVLSFLISISIILGRDFFVSDSRAIQIFKIGVLANFVSLPITLGFSAQFGMLNLIYNLIYVLFISTIVLPMTFLVLIFSQFSDIYHIVIKMFESSLVSANNFNYFIDFTFPNQFTRTLYWLSLLFFFVFFHDKRRRYGLMGLGLAILLAMFAKDNPFISYIRVLDVNQGDAIHLHDEYCDILIDTGSKDEMHRLNQYFISQGIDKLDMLIVSHLHQDHYGELNHLYNSLLIDEVFLNQETDLIGSIDYQVLREGDEIRCSKFNLEVISAYNGSNENNNSIVMILNILNDVWLLTGDIEYEIEMKLIESHDLKVDVLKVAHHGSHTSSHEDFLKIINPDYALISVGKNKYGHPSSKTITNFNKLSIDVLRTDESGSITFYYLNHIDIVIIEEFWLDKKNRMRFN